MVPLSRILRHDYYSRLLLIFIAMGWTAAPITVVMGWVKHQGHLAGREAIGLMAVGIILATVITVIALPLYLYRVKKIRRVCSSGAVVPGKVLGNVYADYRGRPPSSWQGGGALVVEYAWNNTSIKAWHAVWRSPEVEAYEEGEAIPVLVDPQQPNFALPRDLYISSGS